MQAVGTRAKVDVTGGEAHSRVGSAAPVERDFVGHARQRPFHQGGRDARHVVLAHLRASVAQQAHGLGVEHLHARALQYLQRRFVNRLTLAPGQHV